MDTHAALAAVEAAYSTRKESDYGRSVIYTDEMHRLLTAPEQLREAKDGDPLCLFHYFRSPVGDWWVYAAERNPKLGVVLYAYADLFRDQQGGEIGPVLLSQLAEFGKSGRLTDFPVELDRYYRPERLSRVMDRRA